MSFNFEPEYNIADLKKKTLARAEICEESEGQKMPLLFHVFPFLGVVIFPSEVASEGRGGSLTGGSKISILYEKEGTCLCPLSLFYRFLFVYLFKNV